MRHTKRARLNNWLSVQWTAHAYPWIRIFTAVLVAGAILKYT